MSIVLRNVLVNTIRQQQHANNYPSEQIKPVQRKFLTSEALNGNIRVIETSETVIKIYQPNHSGKCMWCRNDVPETENIGIPISLKNTEGEIIIKTVGTSCCFEHSAALILRSYNWNVNYRNTAETNSWYICQLLYNLIYPGKKLLPAPDYQIVVNNTPKALADANSKFIPIPGVRLIQSEYEYQMTQLT